ncbi:MAG: putative quinol monooxygenase [Candidatus Thorarchaeota archaeon]
MVIIPITLIATVKVREGNMEKAKEVLKKLAPKIKESEPGTIEYTPYTVKQDPNVIMFYEVYKNEEALKTHSASLGKNMAELGPLLVPERPNIKNLEEIL